MSDTRAAVGAVDRDDEPAAPVRVLLAISHLHGGGSERQLIGLLKRLDRRRFAPHLYLTRREGELLEEVPDDVPIHAFWDGRAAPRWNWPGRIHRQQVTDFRQRLRAWRIEVVYERNFHTTLVAGPACGAVPRLPTVVSDPDFDLRSQETRFVARKRSLLRRAYHRAWRVLTVSEGVRQALLDDFQVPADRVETLYSPLDLERIDRLSREPPAVELPPEQQHLVTAGRLIEAKGAWDWLETVRRLVLDRGLDSLCAHWLGDGPLREPLSTEIRRLGLERHARLEGFQSNPYAIFRRAHALCHPSHSEGLPNVLLEAMACELPVIACDCRHGPREILAGGEFGTLTAVGDPPGMADALERLLRQGPDAAQLAAARARVEEQFGPVAAVRRLEQLLWQAARGGSS